MVDQSKDKQAALMVSAHPGLGASDKTQKFDEKMCGALDRARSRKGLAPNTLRVTGRSPSSDHDLSLSGGRQREASRDTVGGRERGASREALGGHGRAPGDPATPFRAGILPTMSSNISCGFERCCCCFFGG